MLVNCALCCANLKDSIKAIKYCEAALNLDPKSAKATKQMALALFELRRLEEAKDWTKKAIMLATGDKSLRELFELIRA